MTRLRTFHSALFLYCNIHMHLHTAGLLTKACDCRAVAFTALNAQSSRSHGIVMLTIIKRPSSTPKNRAVGQKVKIGKLFMVDLAGSERLKKSRSTGRTAFCNSTSSSQRSACLLFASRVVCCYIHLREQSGQDKAFIQQDEK